MTAICYVGIEISANFQKALLGIELTMLMVLSVVALVKVGNGTAPLGHLTPALTGSTPSVVTSSAFVDGLTLMLFIYWGWDTAVSVNEETTTSPSRPAEPPSSPPSSSWPSTSSWCSRRSPMRGSEPRESVWATPLTKTTSSRCWAGRSSAHQGLGSFLTHLLLLMVLSSAAASTQTTILPTARTTLSMAVYKAIPSAFAKIHRRFLTPTISTLAMGGVSIAFTWP